MMKIPDSYANGNVKREILDKPYEEINGNTDISFEYQLIYEKLPSGQQSIGAVQFKVKKVNRNRTIVEYETIEKNGESVVATEEEQEIIELFDCSVKEAKDDVRGSGKIFTDGKGVGQYRIFWWSRCQYGERDTGFSQCGRIIQSEI